MGRKNPVGWCVLSSVLLYVLSVHNIVCLDNLINYLFQIGLFHDLLFNRIRTYRRLQIDNGLVIAQIHTTHWVMIIFLALSDFGWEAFPFLLVMFFRNPWWFFNVNQLSAYDPENTLHTSIRYKHVAV